jgi:hypothetical protein
MQRIINLQTPADAHAFIERTGGLRGRKLANRLGLSGRDSTLLANNIHDYASDLRCFAAATTDTGRRTWRRCLELRLILIGRCQAASQVNLLT